MTQTIDEIAPEDRLTAEEYEQYMELLSDIPPPIAPLFSRSPPLSPLSAAASLSSGSGSSGQPRTKRKYAEYASGDTSSDASAPRKRSKMHTKPLPYIVPPRIRRGGYPRVTSFANIFNRAVSSKKLGDSLQSEQREPYTIVAQFKRLHHYASSILDFAFHIKREVAGKVKWSSMMGLLDLTAGLSKGLRDKYPSPHLDAWNAYLHLFRNMVELAVDREHLKSLRGDLVTQLNLDKQQRTLTSSSPASTLLSPPKPLAQSAASPGAATAAPPSSQSAKPDRSPATVTVTFDQKQAQTYESAMARVRMGYNTGEHRAKVAKHLNMAVLKRWFPRTYMRAFGEEGVGHTLESMLATHGGITPESGESLTARSVSDISPTPQRPINGKGPIIAPLQPWEDHEILDLDEEEAHGGDFPYPHNAEDVIWILVLGKSLVTELDFYSMAEAERLKVDTSTTKRSQSPLK